jgi:hypothetical protein
VPPILKEALAKLAAVGGFALHVSSELTGEPTDQAGELASMLHAKMCAHASSIGALCQASLFDHSAILNMGRMMMEALTMYAYLMEPTAAEQWNFRYLVLRLHDTQNRINFVRLNPESGGLGSLIDGREELKARIQGHAEFLKLEKERQERILQGSEMFVVGMRKVARLAVGWASENFNSLYSYFSAHSHSSPMSFMRMREHKTDYVSPKEAQYAMARLAIFVATSCLRRVTLRQLESHPQKISAFPASFVEEMKLEDAFEEVFRWSPEMDEADVSIS